MKKIYELKNGVLQSVEMNEKQLDYNKSQIPYMVGDDLIILDRDNKVAARIGRWLMENWGALEEYKKLCELRRMGLIGIVISVWCVGVVIRKSWQIEQQINLIKEETIKRNLPVLPASLQLTWENGYNWQIDKR